MAYQSWHSCLVQCDLVPLKNTKKQKKISTTTTATQWIQKTIKIINETLHKVQEDLEDAQELNGHLVLSENNKMTEIDKLKVEIQQLKSELGR